MKVGEEYEIIGDTSHHLFKEGSVVRAIEVPSQGEPFRAVGYVALFDKTMDRWVNVKDVREMVEVVTEQEEQEAIASIRSAIH